MKTYMALDGLRWSRDSGSANCDMPRSAVFGRSVGGVICVSLFFLQHRNYSTWYLGLNFFILPMLLLIIKRYDIKWNWLLWLGTISLESYLTNTTLPSYVKMIPWHHLSIDINFGNYLGYGIVIIGGLIWAYLIHKLSAVIIKII